MLPGTIGSRGPLPHGEGVKGREGEGALAPVYRAPLPPPPLGETWAFESQEALGLGVLAGDFPASPVVKFLFSQCRGPQLDPWSGN